MKAISPVIATVIIVAVAIAISIAVALWITGVVGGMTKTERLDITYANAQKVNATTWTITLEVYNKGSVDVTIDRILINNQDYTSRVTGNTIVPAGGHTTLTINISTADGFSAGQNLQIIVHTATGGQYPTQVVLP